MKDTTLTIRLPRATRERIEEAARREGRSLSQQVERLLELGFAALTSEVGEAPARRWGPRPLAGRLADARVPGLEDFQAVRRELSGSIDARSRDRADRRR